MSISPSKTNKVLGIGSVHVFLQVASALKFNIALCGAHGRAKTSVIEEYAAEDGYELIINILSRLAPEDMIGLPTTGTLDGETVTKFSNPDWLVRASDGKSKVMLFFDEFNNAELDTQASILDLIESRRANGLTLNDDCQIVMAFNPISIAPNAKPLSKATRDRICVIPILDSASENDYKKYYKSKGLGGLAEIVGSMDNLVQNYDDEVVEEADKNAEPTYRSIEKCFNIVKYCYDNNIDSAYADAMVCGFIGKIGHAFTSAALEKCVNRKKKSRIKEAYDKGGIDELITLIGNNSEIIGNDFAENAQFVDELKDTVTPLEFDKLLHRLFHREFITKYESLAK